MRVWFGERAGAGAEACDLEDCEVETMQRAELDGAVEPEDARESGKSMDLEKLAEMSLESLLYYVLVGEGRRSIEPVEG